MHHSWLHLGKLAQAALANRRNSTAESKYFITLTEKPLLRLSGSLLTASLAQSEAEDKGTERRTAQHLSKSGGGNTGFSDTDSDHYFLLAAFCAWSSLTEETE